MTTLICIMFVFVALHFYRQYWAHKVLPQLYFGSFDQENGDIYTVEETVIAVQYAKKPSDKTIICFPGFTEDARYFQAAYKDCEHDVIYMGNAGYHSPFSLERAQPLNWPKNPYDMGTIQHDGFWLGQVLNTLAASKGVVIHGHSRGGAVALECGLQFPQVTIPRVSLILEAAVVPKGTAAGPMASKWAHIIMPYLLPLLFAMNRRITLEKLAKMPVMRPSNPLKANLLLSMFSTPKQYKTFVDNVKNLSQWQQETSFNVYQNFKKITALIGQRDDVLDCKTMIASVKEGVSRNDGMEMLQTKHTNHFISVEMPHYIEDVIKDHLQANELKVNS